MWYEGWNWEGTTSRPLNGSYWLLGPNAATICRIAANDKLFQSMYLHQNSFTYSLAQLGSASSSTLLIPPLIGVMALTLYLIFNYLKSYLCHSDPGRPTDVARRVPSSLELPAAPELRLRQQQLAQHHPSDPDSSGDRSTFIPS